MKNLVIISIMLIAVKSTLVEAQPAVQQHGTKQNTSPASRLRKQLVDDKAFKSLACLTFEEDETGEKSSDFAIREKHTDGCPGDPEVAPVIERFRVESSGTILWLNVVDDQWKSYDEFLKSRQN